MGIRQTCQICLLVAFCSSAFCAAAREEVAACSVRLARLSVVLLLTKQYSCTSYLQISSWSTRHVSLGLQLLRFLLRGSSLPTPRSSGWRVRYGGFGRCCCAFLAVHTIAPAVSRFELFLWTKEAASLLRRAPAVSRRMLQQCRRVVPVDSEESELLEHLVLSCLSVRLCIVTKFPEQHSFRISHDHTSDC